ncbi:hypothetical protein TNCT_204801 [Trichonephila clavata]|uniref:Uncharacterized protein n=1 Tax=Trichonephila clavata TaxID=2740835 RepID=A0A8X6M1G4_TRICU|nr:hypothetical protein TNCT_204801 [Trichonephila clavata]
MSSRVANRLPRIGSLILGIRSNSQGEMSGRYGGCSNSSHPQRRISTLCGLAELLHCLQDPDVYPECPVVPVAPVSQCSTARSPFCHEETKWQTMTSLTSYATTTINLTGKGF